MKEVLVVDDDSEFADFIRLVLGKEGFTVAAASTGEEAVRLAEERSFSLVFLDLHLPNAPGSEICRKLKELGLRVVMVSGDARAVEEGRQAGADLVLLKPLRPQEIREAARKVLGWRE